MTSNLNFGSKSTGKGQGQINSNLSEKFALNNKGQNSSNEKCRTVSSSFRSVLYAVISHAIYNFPLKYMQLSF